MGLEHDTAKELLDSVVVFNKAAGGDSGDTEYEAAIDMRDSALEFLRTAAARDIELAELIDQYEEKHILSEVNDPE